MIINDALLDGMFDDKDTARFGGKGGSAKKDDYLTEGPGSYVLEVTGMKSAVSEKEDKFGQTYIVFEFEVLSAEPVKDADGKLHDPTHAPGAQVSMVKYMSGRISSKEAVIMSAAIMGTPPVVGIPEGEYAGQLLPLVSNAAIQAACEDDGERVKGAKVFVNCVPKEGTKKHVGKTFYNCYPKPASDDGNHHWPTWEEMTEAGLDLDALVQARFG